MASLRPDWRLFLINLKLTALSLTWRKDSGERGLPACPRRQLADEIVFGKLPNTAGKLPALPRKINGHDARWPHSEDGCATFFSTGRRQAAAKRKGLPG